MLKETTSKAARALGALPPVTSSPIHVPQSAGYRHPMYEPLCIHSDED